MRKLGASAAPGRENIATSPLVIGLVASIALLGGMGYWLKRTIATNAAMGLMEPTGNGIGGDMFAIYWDAGTGKLTGLNASGWAPKELTIELLKSLGNHSMPQVGIQSVTVPGAVDGWAKLYGRFGRLPWAELFQPAIYYADHGFPLTELIQEQWSHTTGKLSKDENARRVFLRDGVAPKLGEMFRDPQLGSALKLISTQGEEAFYRGPIARAILSQFVTSLLK